MDLEVSPENKYRQPGTVEPHKSWLSNHHVLGYIFLFAVLASIVAGIYYWQTSSNIPSTFEAPVHKEKTDPMADWQTYTSTEYGFEFKYPGRLYERKDSYSLFNIQNTPMLLELGGALSLEAENGTEGKDYVTQGYQFYVNIVDRKTADEANKDGTYTIKDLELSSIEAKRYDLTDGITRGPIVYIINPNFPEKYFVIGYQALCFDSKTCSDNEVAELFDQILSTFKFFDITNPDNRCSTGQRCE